jgi:hypothetical protein
MDALWGLLAVVVLLLLVASTLVGFVVIVKRVFGRRVARPVAAPPEITASFLRDRMTRRLKLEVAAEVLGERLPHDLRGELARWRGEPPPPPVVEAAASLPSPGPAPDPPAAQTQPPAPSPAPIPPPPAPHALAAESDLGDAVGTPVGLPVDDRPLAVDPEVARAARRATPGLRAFLSFENVIFVLSAVLILGGTLYFAAVTWGRVPDRWQAFFVEATSVFYGGMLLLGARYLDRRLQLRSAAAILATISSCVGVVCAAMAVTSFQQHLLPGFLGAALGAVLAYLGVGSLLRTLGEDDDRAALYAAAVLLVGLAGGPAAAGWPVGAGLCLLASAAVAVGLFVRGGEQVAGTHLALVVAVPLSGLLLVVPEYLALRYAAPALTLLAWAGPAARRAGGGWAEAGAVLAAAVGTVLAIPSVGAVAVCCLVSCAALMRLCAAPAPDDAGPVAPPRLAPVAAGLAWVVLSTIWAPAVGLLLSDDMKAWLVGVVTRPGERVSASWDGLAALPFAFLALWLCDRLRRVQALHRRHAEATGWAVLGVGAALTLATYHWQPLPTAVTLGLYALLAHGWAFRAGGWGRQAPAHVLLVVAAWVGGFAVHPEAAHLVGVLVALAIMGAAGHAGRVVGTLVAPPLLVALLVEDVLGARDELVALWSAYGILALWQFLPPVLTWVRPFGPPALLGALLILCFHHVYPGQPLVHGSHALLVATLGVAVAAAWVAVRRGPRFLHLEVVVASLFLGVVGTANALDRYPGDDVVLRFALPACVAILSLWAAARAATGWGRPASWVLATWALPVASVALGDNLMAWHGAVVALACMASLCLFSREGGQRGLAALGLLGGLAAVLWGTLALAAHFSTGGGEERVLTALGSATALYGVLVVSHGPRFSGADEETTRQSCVATLWLALLLALLGTVLVRHPLAVDVALALANVALVGVFSLLLALRHRRGWLLYVTEASVLGTLAYLRERTDLLDFLGAYDVVALAASAFLLLGLSRLLGRTRSRLGAEETRRVAMALPLVVPFLVGWNGTAAESVALCLSAALYAVQAVQGQGSRYGWLAAIFLNAMLVPVWLSLHVGSAMVYLLPVGFSLLVLSRLYAGELGDTATPLRTLASLLVFGSSAYESFRFDDVVPALVLAGLAVGGVLLGIAWRLRSYLYAGFAFLVLDVVVNLTRLGMRDRLVAGVLGVLGGMALFVLGVAVARHKERLLERYRAVRVWDW